MNWKNAVLTGAFLGSFALAGCGPAYVAYQVPAPPPPQVVGAMGFAPGAGYVWVDGFWDLRGSRWAWVNGRWARPPRPGARWERDRWEREGNRWRYYRGHWR